MDHSVCKTGLTVCLILGFMVCQLICQKDENFSSMMSSAGKGRAFGVFSIINFPNFECTASNGDTGTCMTASECSAKGGTVSGICAKGFGACCTIYYKECGGFINHNTTYITNPGYPTAYTTAGSCTWMIQKVASDVCFIRVDLDAMTIADPGTSNLQVGQCTTDYLQGSNANTGNNIVSTTGNKLAKICGINSGQHFYMDAGPYTSDSASLTATLTGSTDRTWKMKVSQIECDNTSRPPQGCFQYHTGVGGTVRSFNFDQPSSNYLHLANQYYKTCIRRESGYCKIAWTQSEDPDSFKISRPAPNYKSNTGYKGCGPDSVKIPHGSNNGAGSCTTPGPTTNPYVDRYCGGTLNCNFAALSPNIIISDRVPFELEVSFSSTDPSSTANRGFCLNYAQMPCKN